MSLLDKLEKIDTPQSIAIVAGIRFKVTGKSLLDGAKIGESARVTNKKREVKLPLDAFWLAACVSDAEDGSELTPEQWAKQPKQITGPLVVELSRLSGLDDEDIERDPKGSSTTAT